MLGFPKRVRLLFCFFFQAEDGIRDGRVTGVQTCALPIYQRDPGRHRDPHPAAARHDCARLRRRVRDHRPPRHRMTPRWPPLPRRLPRTPAPLRHETYESYLARLAAANSLSFDDLDEIAHLYDDDLDGLDQLAALTGYLATVLRHAIPELFHHQAAGTTALDGTSPTPREFINDIRPPCRRCAASAGADPGTARVWAAHDACVCVRHQLWIGEGNDQPSHQLDLGSHPDIVHAQ